MILHSATLTQSLISKAEPVQDLWQGAPVAPPPRLFNFKKKPRLVRVKVILEK